MIDRKAKVQALVRQMGVDLQVRKTGPCGLDIDMWSPKGKAFNATGCHSVVVCNYTSPFEAWTAALWDLEEGLSDCEVEDCETCNDR